jgi:hypothetical protein
MIKRIVFYAAKDDLKPVFDEVEKNIELEYVKCGWLLSEEFECVSNGTKIPNLGLASGDQSAQCDSYLAYPMGAKLNPRAIVLRDGTQRWTLDQLDNPDTIEVTPAGIWKDNVVIYGQIATASDSVQSQQIMKKFRAAIKKNFEKIRAFPVGPNAAQMLDSGCRLTISAKSPPEYDLSRE